MIEPRIDLSSVSFVIVPPRPPISKLCVFVIFEVHVCPLGLTLKLGSEGERSQNFVLLPWKISDFIGINELALLELSSGFWLS